MLRFVYRALQRVLVLEGVAVLVGETAGVSQSTVPGHDIRVVSQEQIKRYIADGQAPYCEELVDRLDNRKLWCFGVIEDDRLMSFAWFYVGSAEAEMNRGYCPATATAIRLADNTAFVFHAYTAQPWRGRGLMTGLLSAAAKRLREEAGATHLVGTTELVNGAALAAFAKAGIKKQASYWRFGIGRWAAGWYPAPRLPVLGYGSGQAR